MAPFGGIGPTIAGLNWALMALSITLVVLRGIFASRKNGALRWDFVWIATACVSAFITAIVISIAVSHGLGNHLSVITPFTEVFAAVKWLYMSLFIGAISICFAKFAIIALLLEVQSGGARSKPHVYGLWTVGAIFGITTVLEIVLLALQCSPTTKLWNLSEPGVCSPSHKNAARYMSYTHAAIGGTTDLMLAIWPVSIVYNLQTSLRVKVGFCLLMAVGAGPAIASFIRMWMINRFVTSVDPTYDYGAFIIACCAELFSLLILGSIPPLRPVFMRVFYGVRAVSPSMGHSGASDATGSRASGKKGGARTGRSRGAQDADEVELVGKGSSPIMVKYTYEVKDGGPVEV